MTRNWIGHPKSADEQYDPEVRELTPIIETFEPAHTSMVTVVIIMVCALAVSAILTSILLFVIAVRMGVLS